MMPRALFFELSSLGSNGSICQLKGEKIRTLTIIYESKTVNLKENAEKICIALETINITNK